MPLHTVANKCIAQSSAIHNHLCMNVFKNIGPDTLESMVYKQASHGCHHFMILTDLYLPA